MSNMAFLLLCCADAAWCTGARLLLMLLPSAANAAKAAKCLIPWRAPPCVCRGRRIWLPTITKSDHQHVIMIYHLLPTYTIIIWFIPFIYHLYTIYIPFIYHLYSIYIPFICYYTYYDYQHIYHALYHFAVKTLRHPCGWWRSSAI